MDSTPQPINSSTLLTSDICIVGAGPGGAAAALKLSYMGVSCVLIDKATFPRDKVCGDAISGKVTTLLNRLDPEILHRFNARPVQVDVWGIKFIVPNGKELDIPFKPGYIRDEVNAPGYVSRRIDFDNFLIGEVRRRENITFLEGVEISGYDRLPDGYRLISSAGAVKVETRLLLVSDGAHSGFSRKVAGLEKDAQHHAGAVRAYFRNVGGMHRHNFIELHFLKELIPGYFWIFPLPDGYANVGVGMRSDIIKKRKFNLRKSLDEIVRDHPLIRERFRHAVQEGPVVGYGLPLGSKPRAISGDHYMLIGDAGHLVDPLTGEGIGNAFYSGFIAAEQAVQCLETGNFSAAFLKAYDARVARVLGTEMKLSYRLQQIGRHAFLLNAIAHIIHGNRRILDYFSRMYTDFGLREQLAKPWFWLKMLFRR